jgi:Ribbon-helix-helix protein, copG family
MRTTIDIPDDQAGLLAVACRRNGISQAEAIRRSIALFIKQEVPGAEGAFGLWKERGIDGVEFQQSLRREWSE